MDWCALTGAMVGKYSLNELSERTLGSSRGSLDLRKERCMG